MKLLMLAPYSPAPPNSGGRMRLWHEAKFLGKRHALTLVAFYQTAQERDAQQDLREFCERVYPVERPSRPDEADMRNLRALDNLFDWYTTPEMARVLEPLQKEHFDAVILQHIFMAHYAGWFRAPAVLEEHNIESEIFRQHANATVRGTPEHTFRQTRWMMLRKYEDALWNQFPLRVVMSEQDKQQMDARAKTGKTIVVENGIDPRESAVLPRARRRTLLFMGALDFFPNIDALYFLRDEILPRLWERDPRIELVIAGRRPPQAIRAFAQDTRVRVIADPEGMDEIARDCAAVVTPLRMGSGTRVKILHALAMGLPVVTTAKGAEGLAVRDEEHLLIRDAPRAYAEAVLRVLDDDALAERLRSAGRALVESRYDWEMILPRYEAELEGLHCA